MNDQVLFRKFNGYFIQAKMCLIQFSRLCSIDTTLQAELVSAEVQFWDAIKDLNELQKQADAFPRFQKEMRKLIKRAMDDFIAIRSMLLLGLHT